MCNDLIMGGGRRSAHVERSAETHYFLRRQLINVLDGITVPPEARKHTLGCVTYGDYWRESFGDRFFDMTTIIRLGTGIEAELRDYHRQARSANASALRKDQLGIFQRLVDPADLAALLHSDCGYDLYANAHLGAVQELMVHRHLYAHRSGVPDDKYVADVLRLTGVDLLPNLQAAGYSDTDIYWFAPLNDLPRFIEAARAFVADLP
jgi:hypothetical protein